MPKIELSTPFIGRGQEIVRFNEILSEALLGRGRLVFLAGEAGVGKSRLCEEFGELAKKAKFRVTSGRCIPGAPSPYLPFQDAFEHYFHRESRSDNFSKKMRKIPQETGLWRWLKGPEHREFDLEPDTERERTFHATLELLLKLSNEKPILIVLDDLQWADTASIQLLHFIGRNSQGLNLVMIGTYRPEDLPVPRDGTVHPLLETLRIMRREGICYEMSLGPLNIEELTLALGGLLGGKVDSESSQRIYTESGGNPLFAVETIRWLLETGKIHQENDIWTVAAPGQIDMPATIREVIQRRIERLPENQKHILEYASVVGEWFDPTIIENGLRQSRLDLLENLDRIQRDSQLIIASDETYKFSHEKIRRVLYESLSTLRRKELHKIVAHVLESQLPNENLYGQLSYHLHNTGELERCGQYSLLAGQVSQKNGGLIEALLYFERTLETLTKDGSLNERLQATEGLGDCNKAIGRFDAAFSWYQEYLKFTQNARDKARVLRKSAEIAPSSQVVTLLDEAETGKEMEQIEEGRIKRIRGHLEFSVGALNSARKFYAEAQKLFEQKGASEDYAYSLLDHTALHLAQGEVRQAEESATEASKIITKIRSPGGDLAVSKQFGDILFNQGRYEEALQRYARVMELGSKYGRYPYLSFARVYRTGIFIALHDFESALKEGLVLREYAKMARFPYDRISPTLLLAFALIKSNRVEEGEKLYNEASQVLDSLELEKRVGLLAGPDIRFYSMPLNLAVQKSVLAELLAAKGDFAGSNEAYRRSIESWRGAVNSFAFCAVSRLFYAESLLSQGNKEEAKKQLHIVLETYRKLGNERGSEAVARLIETTV